MLKEGKRKLINQGKIIPSILCDAEALPFPNNYFDCVTIGFGLRNMTNKERALKEIYRVLSPGGKVIILEFSKIWQRQHLIKHLSMLLKTSHNFAIR